MKKGNLMPKWNNYNQSVENKYQQIDNLFATPAGGFFTATGETGVSLITPLQHI